MTVNFSKELVKQAREGNCIAIDELFRQVSRGEREPRELKEELDRWGLFEEYEDRFFNVFKKRR